MHETSLDRAVEELVYRHPNPPDRVRQGLRVGYALSEIVEERTRQETIGERKRAQGIPWRSCADPDMDGGDDRRFLVLGEEVGEVANAVLERGYGRPDDPTSVAYQVRETGSSPDDHVREELVQVAAVALAWIEAIDERNGR